MKIHEVNLVMYLAVPGAEGLTIVRRGGGVPGGSSECTGSCLCRKNGVHALKGAHGTSLRTKGSNGEINRKLIKLNHLSNNR